MDMECVSTVLSLVPTKRVNIPAHVHSGDPARHVSLCWTVKLLIYDVPRLQTRLSHRVHISSRRMPEALITVPLRNPLETLFLTC